jgi:hypothetical protein
METYIHPMIRHHHLAVVSKYVREVEDATEVTIHFDYRTEYSVRPTTHYERPYRTIRGYSRDT